MNNFSHRVWIIFRIAVCVAMCPAALMARVELRAISASGGSVSFSFSELPRTAIAELSPDKTRIALRIPDAVASDKAREGIKATDNVELVSTQQKGSELTVYVVLRKKGGCTQVRLPYSRTLRLYIVDWEKLSSRDNLYHSGLLSLESGVPISARENFKRAASAGVGDAAAMAGISLVAEGNISEAERELRRATDLGTSVPDVYAALADIATYRNDTARVRQYSDRFRRMSGLTGFPSLLGHLPKESTAPVEPQTIAQSLLVDEPAAAQTDTTASTGSTDSSLNAQVSQQARALITDSAARETPAERTRTYTPGDSLVPSWMKWAVFGFLFFVCASIAGIGYLYVRWRKKQLQRRNLPAQPEPQSEQQSFEREVNSAMQSVTARRAADIYGRSSGEEPPAAEPEAPAPQPVEPVEEVPQRHWMDEIDTEEEIAVNPPPAAELPEASASDNMDALAQKLRKGRGELELAVKLLNRKKQDGRDKSGEIAPEDIPGKPGQLSRLAGTLGVGTGELEIRRNLGSAEESGRVEKMRSLFGATKGK